MNVIPLKTENNRLKSHPVRSSAYFYVVCMVVLIFCIIVPSSPVLAINEPDGTSSIEFSAYRNVLSTGDFFIFGYENTPYDTAPDEDYSQTFVWRMFDPDGDEELAQATAPSYNENGYGYNVIGWYFDSGNITALMPGGYWQEEYIVRLTGTPVGFPSDPPTYEFVISVGDYSSLTDTDEVKAAIAIHVLNTAADLNNKWGLATSVYLTEETEAATKLSLYGQSFFRQAIYGIQAMAPAAFSINIADIDTDDRTWTTTYVTQLEEQYAGTYLGTALDAGETLFDVNYNLAGMLGIFMICALIVFAHWYLGVANLWKGMLEATPALVIGARLALFGLGELGLLAAIAWLFISAKSWKVI